MSGQGQGRTCFWFKRWRTWNFQEQKHKFQQWMHFVCISRSRSLSARQHFTHALHPSFLLEQRAPLARHLACPAPIRQSASGPRCIITSCPGGRGPAVDAGTAGCNRRAVRASSGRAREAGGWLRAGPAAVGGCSDGRCLDSGIGGRVCGDCDAVLHLRAQLACCRAGHWGLKLALVFACRASGLLLLSL